MREQLLQWAKDAGYHAGVAAHDADQLERFAELVAKHEREQCALLAEVRYSVLRETEEAHYRLSERPFNPSNFGFDLGVVEESKAIASAIRARGNQ